MGEDGALFGQEIGAEGSHLLAMRDVFVVETFGECDDSGLDLGDGGVFGRELVIEITDLADTPEEVDGSGAGRCERGADDGDLGAKGWDGCGCGAFDAESDAHGAGDADGGGAAYDHVADDGSDFLIGG